MLRTILVQITQFRTIDKRQNGVRRFDVLKSSNCDQMNYQLYYFDEIGPNLKSKSIDDKSILSINEIMCQAKIYVQWSVA